MCVRECVCERVCVREIVTEDLRVARRRRESVYVSERKYFECVRMCVYHREREGEREAYQFTIKWPDNRERQESDPSK